MINERIGCAITLPSSTHANGQTAYGPTNGTNPMWYLMARFMYKLNVCLYHEFAKVKGKPFGVLLGIHADYCRLDTRSVLGSGRMYQSLPQHTVAHDLCGLLVTRWSVIPSVIGGSSLSAYSAARLSLSCGKADRTAPQPRDGGGLKPGPHRTRQRCAGPVWTVRARSGPFRPVKIASSGAWRRF